MSRLMLIILTFASSLAAATEVQCDFSYRIDTNPTPINIPNKVVTVGPSVNVKISESRKTNIDLTSDGRLHFTLASDQQGTFGELKVERYVPGTSVELTVQNGNAEEKLAVTCK